MSKHVDWYVLNTLEQNSIHMQWYGRHELWGDECVLPTVPITNCSLHSQNEVNISIHAVETAHFINSDMNIKLIVEMSDNFVVN